MYQAIKTFLCTSTLLTVVTITSTSIAAEPVPVIFDTDMMGDVDDVGATAVLHALATRGEAKILAMGVCVKNPAVPLCLDAMNTWFGRGEIPVGVVKGPAANDRSKYADKIAHEFPHRLKSAAEAEDATVLYRRILAGQPDASVVIVSVGMLTNLRNLLKSRPDAASPLDGRALVKKKVRAWVSMGGAFPKGREYNIYCDTPAAVEAVKDWPTPVVFSGFEIGNEIMTGKRTRQLPAASPVRRAYELYNGLDNRQSWDQTAVLYAVRGLDGHLPGFWETRSGWMEVRGDGSNVWHDDPHGPHKYLVKSLAPPKVAAAIEDLMLEHSTQPPQR